MSFSFALLAAGAARGAGSVVAWGASTHGELLVPLSVDATTGTASAIAVGSEFTIAIRQYGAPVPSLSPFGVDVLGSVLLAAGYAPRQRRA